MPLLGRSEKIAPTVPLTSRFEEPSTGSQATTSACCPLPSAISMGSGASSETSAAHAPVLRKAGILAVAGGTGTDAADDRGHAAGLLPGGEKGLLLGQVRLQCHP